jgi:hypothetical protein
MGGKIEKENEEGEREKRTNNTCMHYSTVGVTRGAPKLRKR